MIYDYAFFVKLLLLPNITIYPKKKKRKEKRGAITSKRKTKSGKKSIK